MNFVWILLEFWVFNASLYFRCYPRQLKEHFDLKTATAITELDQKKLKNLRKISYFKAEVDYFKVQPMNVHMENNKSLKRYVENVLKTDGKKIFFFFQIQILTSNHILVRLVETHNFPIEEPEASL